MSIAKKTVQLTTKELYNLWSRTYDTDGNVLQKIDTEAFIVSIPRLIASQKPIKVLDLGCGTGRNTEKLVSMLPSGSTIFAIDASEAMISSARERLKTVSKSNVEINWIICDVTEQELGLERVDAVVSTLVIEHLALDVFFRVVAGALKNDGWAYISDMHPQMETSRAGFLNEDEGVKVQGVSWNHGIKETITAAEEAGLFLLGAVDERGVVDTDHAKRLGSRARKWIGRNLFVGMGFILKKSPSNFDTQ